MCSSWPLMSAIPVKTSKWVLSGFPIISGKNGDSNCLESQARRGAPAYSEARMPQLTDQRSRLPHSVSQPCDAGSMAHATVRACSECRRDDPRCPTVFEDLGTIGLSRLGCLKAYRERTPT